MMMHGSIRTLLVTVLLQFTMNCRAELRTWTHSSGKTIDAEYIGMNLSDDVLLRKSDGTQVKVPLSELSDEDLDHVALQNPPKLKIEFSDSSKVDTLDSSDRWPDNPAVTEETVQFKVRIRQIDMKDYDHTLSVEYYAIGYQYLDQDKYMLIYKGTENFVIGDDNNREIEFRTEEFTLPLEFTFDSNHYGRKPCGHLVLVYDQRGQLIAHDTSKSWLYEHRKNLRALPVGAFFDDTCTRRHPTGPKRNY